MRTGSGLRAALPRLTSGRIAAAALAATVRSAQRRVTHDRRPATVAALVLALLRRGGVLGRVQDVETADRLSEDLVEAFPGSGVGHLARARTTGALHRFDAALASLDRAEGYAGPRREVVEECASILQATGRLDDARELWTAALATSPDSHVLGRLACIEAERGAVAAAQDLFDEAVRRYTGPSPVALAGLYHDWGHVHEHAGDLPTAEASYRRAAALLPCHAPAQLGTAAAEVHAGFPAAAVARLRPVCAASDDPRYAAALGLLLRSRGAHGEADDLLAWAGHRFAVLLARHPAAFSAHAEELRHASFHHPLIGAPS